MRGDTTFAEILDAHLGERPAATSAAANASPVSRPAEIYHLPFVRDWTRPSAGGTSSRPFPAVPPEPRREHGRPDRPSRPPRRAPHTLTAAQQAALRELVACGAELREDFTADDLRGTFRSLARRFHPDRHPGATADEQRRLTATFARVNAGYRLLLKKVS